MSMLNLPPELVEHILVSIALGGFPHAIASFSQTCKANHTLVYHPTDHHLWREIFLTTFDDPRRSGGGPGWRECTSSLCTRDDYDWGAEYRRRIWAADYIRRQTTLVTTTASDQVTARNTQAFNILLSVIDTALPCPPTLVLSFLPAATSESAQSTQIGEPIYPTFPPQTEAIRGISRDVNGHIVRARNPAWLTSVLKHGLPPAITALYSAEKWAGGLDGQFLDDPQFSEMQAAGHLMACTGFIPFPGSPPSAGHHGVDSSDPYMSAERQTKRARRLARMRVYNLRYLSRDRHWGPFLPVPQKKGSTSRARADDEELLQPILALFRVAPVHGPGMEHVHHHEEQDEETDSDEEVNEDEDENAIGDEDPGEDDADDLPLPARLRADWAYLAAIRMVVEANLRGHVQEQDMRGLFSLEALRPGSAPWDASTYNNPPASTERLPPESERGKEKAPEAGEVTGWDWAGVNGTWKRCVCWMDYRDLILHNDGPQLSGEFEEAHLQEDVHIVTMDLRIKSYSPASIPEYAHLPTIHVQGKTTGGAPRRRMHGTVSVIADGSVRWTLYSTTTMEDNDSDEWVSECIQLGGVASAMGLLGMWTGATHDRMDPLGPTWAWKVG